MFHESYGWIGGNMSVWVVLAVLVVIVVVVRKIFRKN
jgi:disulfide bond formation protein DsbB